MQDVIAKGSQVENQDKEDQRYLSSSNIEDYSDKEKKDGQLESMEEDNDDEQTFCEKVLKIIIFLTANIVNYLWFLILPIILLSFGLLFGVINLIKLQFKDNFLTFWLIICQSSVIYSFITYLFLPIENDIISQFHEDGLFFFLNSLIVFSYLMTNYRSQNSFKQILSNIDLDYSSYTFQFVNKEEFDKKAYFLDYKVNDIYYINGIALEVSKVQSSIPNSFWLFGEDKKLDSIILYGKFKQYFVPSYKSFLILIMIILTKLIFCFHYILVQVPNIPKKQYVDMTFIIFVYIYTTFNLNRILGNNDLRRKHAFLVDLNNYIDFQNSSSKDLNQKLDITSPLSLETWDNVRNNILSYKVEYLQSVELSYFCLFIYYIFVIMVCLSSFFELYWLIDKESVFLKPIMVIMSSFNFIFLSCFFLIRFYEGNKFNDVFEDIDKSLGYLIDIMEDMQTMFDLYFNCPKNANPKNKEQRKTNHAKVIKKIKHRSNQFIQNKIMFEDKVYTKNEKTILRKNIILNAQLSLQKVKRSLEYDAKQYKYRFLNLVEINFNEIFFTLIFALVTSLPTIVPKFSELYSKEKST